MNNDNKPSIPMPNYNLKINYEPKTLSDVLRQKRLKLTDTKMGNQLNEETLQGRLEKDEQKDI